MDDDFTFNILLSPHAEEETRNEIIMSDPFQGKFIDEQPPTTNLGLNFTQERTYENLFHCEIKGCRVHDVCIALKIMAVAGAGVTTFCALAGAAGLIGWVACLIAIIAWAILTAAVAGITWAATHTGSMDDVLDPASGTISVGDIVLVKGDWVHDAGHDPEGVGWNEIHPVRFVQKLSIPDQFQSDAKADEALVNQFKEEILDVHCFLAKQADDEDVKTEQEKPENDWHIHPSIDGCQKEVVIE